MGLVVGGKYEGHRIETSNRLMFVSQFAKNEAPLVKGNALCYFSKQTVKKVTKVDHVVIDKSTETAIKGAIIGGAAGAIVGSSIGKFESELVEVEWTGGEKSLLNISSSEYTNLLSAIMRNTSLEEEKSDNDKRLASEDNKAKIVGGLIFAAFFIIMMGYALSQ